MSWKKLLSKRDLIKIFEIIHASLECEKEEALSKILIDLRTLVSHDYSIFGIAQTEGEITSKNYKTINVDYPREWIDIYTEKKYYLQDPVFIENFAKSGLQRWTDTYRRRPPMTEFLAAAKEFGLCDGYTFGLKRENDKRTSLFSLSGKSMDHHSRTKAILENIMPHLHQALLRATENQDREKKAQTAAISVREKEILCWLKEGKTSWDISKILNISERTVNFHVSNIIQKLGAVSRIHAIAMAAGLRLIDLD